MASSRHARRHDKGPLRARVGLGYREPKNRALASRNPIASRLSRRNSKPHPPAGEGTLDYEGEVVKLED